MGELTERLDACRQAVDGLMASVLAAARSAESSPARTEFIAAYFKAAEAIDTLRQCAEDLAATSGTMVMGKKE